MRNFLIHPSFALLSRFADGELKGWRSAFVARHLARCSECRDEVAFIRRAGDVARTIPMPSPSDETLQSILARRAEGERVLLPTHDPAPRTRRWRLFPAVVALLGVTAVVLLLAVPTLQAKRSGLRILPAAPRAGETLRVEYRDGGLFAGDTTLLLRARYRTSGHERWNLTAGTLVRDGNGVYRTSVPMPDSVVYAAFAVESTDGSRLDSNDRALWDVMVYDDGRPSRAAMAARVADLTPRNWGGALEQARRMTQAYPRRVESWVTLMGFERSLLNPDSVVAVYRGRYHNFERALADAPPAEPDELAWLAAMALDLGDVDSGEVWLRQALERGAGDPVVGRARVLLVALRPPRETGVELAELDSLWGRWGPQVPYAAQLAIRVAAGHGDIAALTRWIPRFARVRSLYDLGPYLLSLPSSVPAASLASLSRGIEDRIARASDADRPPGMSRAEFGRRRSSERQDLGAVLAELERRAGDVARADSLARSAVELSWNSPALVRLAGTLRALDDSAGATHALARAAADVGAEVPDPPTSRSWNREVADARRALRAYVLDGSVIRYPDLNVPLGDHPDAPPLGSLVGNPAVIAFLHGESAPALDELSGLAALKRRLSSRNVPLVLVATGAEHALATAIRERGLDLSLVTDRTGALRREFRSSGTPEHFVMDARGRTRFEYSSLDAVPRQVEALETAERVLAAAPDRGPWPTSLARARTAL